MKNILIPVYLFLLMFIHSCADRMPTQTDDLTLDTSDTLAIKKVITEETDAFLKRDSVRLLSSYADDNITQSSWNNPNGSYSLLHGLGQIKENFSRAFQAHPEPVYSPEIERADWKFRILSKDWMWVQFTQTIKTLEGKKNTGHEIRLMKKDSNSWKLVVMSALSNHGIETK